MTNFYPFLIYVAVTTFTPGPNNILSMSNAVRDGYRRTLRFLVGICAGFFIVMLASGLLNVALASLLPSLKKGLELLGAVYLLYLAVHVLRSKPAEADSGKNSLNSFRAGFLMQFINVKVILYGITVFSLFIVNDFQDPLSICLFAIGLTAVGFMAISCWALGGDVFGRLLRKYYRAFNLGMAGLLVYTAIASIL
jgi:cysteine/O-acetylserine efflux protein